MLPVVYSASSTEFSSNGQGVLVDCISCSVTEERNGIFEMELTYPEGGQHADKLVVDAIIKATAHKGDSGQLFRIYAIDKNLAGDISCRCQHISYQLSFIPCEPFEATNVSQAFARLQQNMQIKDHKFTFFTDKSNTGEFKIAKPTSARSVLGGMEGSILDTFRGEYEFDNFNVRFLNNRGHDNGVVLRYGKNISDVSQSSDIANTYTALRPFYYDEDELVELDTPDKCLWASNYELFPYKRILLLDCTSEFEDLTDSAGDKRAPTQKELLSYARKYMRNHDFGGIEVSVDVDFEALWESPDYADVANLETVNLCDTVHVLFEPYNISVKSKVVKTVYDTLLDRYSSITVGAAKSNFADAVAGVPAETASMIADASTRLERARQRATDTLLGKNGGFKIEKLNGEGQIIETLYMDSLDEATATKVWRWNINGLGYSPNGPGGPYTVAITKDGEIVADFITTGTLDADKVNVTNLTAENILVNAHLKLNEALSEYEDTFAVYDTRIEANAQGLSSKVSRTDFNGDTIASLIEQSADSVKISANHINLNGATTFNNNVVIGTDGKIKAVGADIKGKITATQLILEGATIDASDVDNLSDVATSGSYNDLEDTPVLPDFEIFIGADGEVHGSDPGEGATGISVSAAGLLTASNAVIWGTIYASGGKIGGWGLDTTKLSKTRGSFEVGIDAPASPAAADKAFYIKDSSGSTVTYPFYVDYSGNFVATKATITGAITADSGQIGNFTIQPNNGYLYSGSGANRAGMGATNHAFWAGSDNTNTAPFSVTYSGDLKANSGTVGGWTLGERLLSKTGTNEGTDYTVMLNAPASPTGTNGAFVIKTTTNGTDDYPFMVRYDGYLKATKGVIGGCTIDEHGNLIVKNINVDTINGNKITGSNSVAASVIDTAITRTTDLPDHIANISLLRVSQLAITSDLIFNYDGRIGTLMNRVPQWTLYSGTSSLSGKYVLTSG